MQEHEECSWFMTAWKHFKAAGVCARLQQPSRESRREVPLALWRLLVNERVVMRMFPSARVREGRDSQWWVRARERDGCRDLQITRALLKLLILFRIFTDLCWFQCEKQVQRFLLFFFLREMSMMYLTSLSRFPQAVFVADFWMEETSNNVTAVSNALTNVVSFLSLRSHFPRR